MKKNIDEKQNHSNKSQEKMVRTIVNSCLSSHGEKAKDRFCYRFYNNVWDQKEFDYLTKVGDYTYPAKVTFTPIVKQDLEYLRSNMARRPFLFKIFAVDHEALERRKRAEAKMKVQIIQRKIQEKISQIRGVQEQVVQKQQQIQNAMNQEPQNEEQAKQMQAQMPEMKEVQRKLSLFLENIENELEFSEDELDKVKQKMNYDYKDHVEEAAYDVFEEGIQQQRILYERVKAFTDKIICGKSLYYVDYQPGMRKVEFQRLSPTATYWSSDSDEQWIQKGRWAAFKYRMNYNQVLEKFNNLDVEQKTRIEKYANIYNDASMHVNPAGGAIFNEETLSNTELYGGTSSQVGGVDVWHVFFRMPRKIYVKKSPNKHKPGTNFTHFSDSKPKTKKNETLYARYVDDIWEGFLIGNDIVTDVRKRPIQHRDPDTYEVNLPVIGLSYNSETESPYSIVWATKDIQRESDLIRYYRQLMFALAGAKGIVMDRAQKPSKMTTKEWLYSRKMGVTWIDSSRKSSYNQFMNYDDTISPAVQYIDGMLANLQELVHTITGVTRQALGQVVATDQVKTNESSIRQSSLVTEILFYENDMIFSEACSEYLNCIRTYKDKGGIVSYMDAQNNFQIKKISEGIFKRSKLKLFVRENTKDIENLKELKQYAGLGFQKGVLGLPELTQLVTSDNIVEVEKKIEYFAEKADKIAAMNAQNAAEAEKQKELEKMKFEQEFEKYIKELEMEMKDKELQVNAYKNELMERDLELKERIELLNANIKVQEIQAENAVEGAYLQEQTRSSKVQERLQELKLEIDTLMGQANLEKDVQANKDKKEVEIKKAESAKNKPKEHISDR